MNKVSATPAAALEGLVFDGMTIAVGGFGLCGIPEQLILALRDSGVKNLTVVSNNAGVDDWGLGLLLQTRQVSKMISSYVGENAEFERQYINDELEIEFAPQGTLAERLRAGGAGIPAFYTPTGAGTLLGEGKEARTIDGKDYILETGLRADLCIIRGHKADTLGNVVYKGTSRNLNPVMATTARITVVEVDEIGAPGELGPEGIVAPGLFVDRIVVRPPDFSACL